MRRKISIGCLLVAWFFANGALWNVVQVVAWVKMFHEYSETMPGGEALQRTFDGIKPCKLCCMANAAKDAAQKQHPRDEALGNGSEKLLLVSECALVVVARAPNFVWPDATDNAGLIRVDAVPVPPPRV
jgi:hypothetical protein